MRAEKGLDKAAACLQGAQKLSSSDSVHCLLYPWGLAEAGHPRSRPLSAWALGSAQRSSPVLNAALWWLQLSPPRDPQVFSQQRVRELPCHRVGPWTGHCALAQGQRALPVFI